MKSANPEGKRGISKTPIIRSDLIERLGAEYGYNYNDPEYRNVTFAEQSDLEIAEKLKEYYTTLDEESLGRLYKRYIGAYSSEELNRDDLIKSMITNYKNFDTSDEGNGVIRYYFDEHCFEYNPKNDKITKKY